MARALWNRGVVAVAALVVTAGLPAHALAAEVTVSAIESTFSNGAGGWTSSSSCAPLCSVTNTVDTSQGATAPGSAVVIYTTLAGLLGGLATGTSTWTSPAFTWTSATPDQASLALASKAAVGGLLAVGGSAGSRIRLDDLTTGTSTVVATQSFSSADGSFGSHSFAVQSSLLKQSHSYRIVLTTTLEAAALLSGIRVSYDDIGLTGTVDSAGGGGSSGTGGTTGGGTTGGSGTTAGTGNPPAGTAQAGALRLEAPRLVRFTPGRAVTVRVRAVRARKAVGHLAISLSIGTTVRRVYSGRDGFVSVRVRPRGRAPLRISFRAGTSGATTWVRPR